MNSSRKPVIGISPGLDKSYRIPQSLETVYVRRAYTQTLEAVGAIPLILNIDMPVEYITSVCDGIVISGGEDINPSLYGGGDSLYVKEPIERTKWELQLLDMCEKQHIPVLGICYGMQLLATYYGGALHQDIETELPNCVNHNISKHDVTFDEPFLGFKSGQKTLVESRHHQAVALLPENFVCAAKAPDGVIEAMVGKGDKYGIQWHPESDETGVHIYRSFVSLCSS